MKPPKTCARRFGGRSRTPARIATCSACLCPSSTRCPGTTCARVSCAVAPLCASPDIPSERASCACRASKRERVAGRVGAAHGWLVGFPGAHAARARASRVRALAFDGGVTFGAWRHAVGRPRARGFGAVDKATPATVRPGRRSSRLANMGSRRRLRRGVPPTPTRAARVLTGASARATQSTRSSAPGPRSRSPRGATRRAAWRA